MSEYLEREALIAATENVPSKTSHGLTKEQCDGANFARLTLAAIFRAIPAADVAPVRHGRWFHSFGAWRCSECNVTASFWCMASTQYLSNYCPECGAKMDGGDDDAADN